MDLRGLYDQLEKAVTPVVNDFTRSDDFAKLATATTEIDRFVRGTARSVSAKLWHLVNLPAGSDLQRLNNQVGSLDREIRLLSMELDRRNALDEEVDRGRDTRPGNA